MTLLLNIEPSFTRIFYSTKTIDKIIRNAVGYEKPYVPGQSNQYNWESLYKSGLIPTGLVRDLLAVLKKKKIPYSLQSYPKSSFKKKKLKFSLRGYQKEALEWCLENPRGIIQLPCGAGKTRISAELFHQIGRGKRTLYLVPYTSILRQTVDFFSESFGIEFKATNDGCYQSKEIVITTPQSALTQVFKIPKDLLSEIHNYRAKTTVKYGKKDGLFTITTEKGLKVTEVSYKLPDKVLEKALKPVFQDNQKFMRSLKQYKSDTKEWENSPTSTFNYNRLCRFWDRLKNVETFDNLLVDEAQFQAANSFFIASALSNAVVRIGFSATPIRTDNKEPLMEGAISKKTFVKQRRDLVEQDFLTDTKYEQLAFDSSEIPLSDSYQLAYSQLMTDESFLDFLVGVYEDRIERENLFPAILLTFSVEQAKLLAGKLSCPFLTGAESYKYRNGIIAELRNKERSLIVGTSILDVGLDVPNLKALVLCGGGESKALFIQRIGRLDRICEGKDTALCLDVAHDYRWFQNHSKSRQDAAKEYGYIVKEVTYTEQPSTDIFDDLFLIT